jgi:hypothetical protein
VLGLGGGGEHRHRVLLEKSRQRADVVDVRVGDQHGFDVRQPPADLGEGREHLVVVSGVPGVDERHGVAVGEQRPVDRPAVHREDALSGFRDLHDRQANAR